MTVNRTEKQDQLNVSWVAPKLKYMDDSMMYQIRYSSADGLETQVESWSKRCLSFGLDVCPSES